MKMLPIVRIKDSYYFMDERLKEFRNMKDPGEIIKFQDFLEMIIHDIGLEYGGIEDGRATTLELHFKKGFLEE